MTSPSPLPTGATRSNGRAIRQHSRRACDQCNVRKVRCRPAGANDGACLPCRHGDLTCTWLKMHKPRGPKRTRLNNLLSGAGGFTRSSADRSNGMPDAGLIPHSFLPFPSHPSLDPLTIVHAPAVHAQNGNVPFAANSLAPSNTSIGSGLPDIETPWPASFPSAKSSRGASSSNLNFDFRDAARAEELSILDTINDASFWDHWPGSAVIEAESRPLPFFDWSLESFLDLRQSTRPSSPMPDPQAAGFSSTPTDQPVAITSTTSLVSHDPVSEMAEIGQNPLLEVLDVYFTHFHPMFPVLDRQRLERLAEPAHKPQPDSSGHLVTSVNALLETRNYLSKQQSGGMEDAEAQIPSLLSAARNLSRKPELGSLNVDDVMARFHLFVVYEMLGEKLAAWIYLQETLTLVQVLCRSDWSQMEADDMSLVDQEQLRLFCIAFITERGVALLQHLPANITRPLRLEDDAYGRTAGLRCRIPDTALANFPVSHLRLFSLAKASYLSCWRGICGGDCAVWEAEDVQALWKELDREGCLALAEWRSQVENGGDRGKIQAANLVFTTAWFKDRFWNICLRHNLLRPDGPGEQSYTYIRENLQHIVDFANAVKSTDLDVGLDFAAKLFDMAMTAVLLVRVTPAERIAGLRAGLLKSVYSVLGLLSSLGRDLPALMPRLVKALAEAL